RLAPWSVPVAQGGAAPVPAPTAWIGQEPAEIGSVSPLTCRTGSPIVASQTSDQGANDARWPPPHGSVPAREAGSEGCVPGRPPRCHGAVNCGGRGELSTAGSRI